jgi:hypothetical protein
MELAGFRLREGNGLFFDRNYGMIFTKEKEVT